MNFIDIFIILILLVIVVSIIYFCFVKNKDNPCKGCPYYKNCSKKECNKK